MNKWNAAILLFQVIVLLVSMFIFIPVFSGGLVESPENDAISLAAQMGRLDVVSLIFAMFGIILALFAFGGFFSIRAHVEQVATKEAAEVAERIANQRVDFLLSSINSRSEPIEADDVDTGGGEKLTGKDDDRET